MLDLSILEVSRLYYFCTHLWEHLVHEILAHVLPENFLQRWTVQMLEYIQDLVKVGQGLVLGRDRVHKSCLYFFMP